MFFSLSCGNRENTIDKRNGLNFPNFEERNTGLDNVLKRQDTLKIIVEFSDCGEWGGHKEYIYLNKDLNDNTIARLIIDSVSCSNIKDYENFSDIDEETRVIVLDTIKQLTKQDEKLLNLFIHRVLELYLNKENLYEFEDSVIYSYAGAGSLIQINNSTLNLEFHNFGEGSNTWYTKIKKMVFETKVEEKRK